MSQNDLAEVMAIERVSHPEPWSEDLFQKELNDPARTCYLVARKDGSLAGYAGYWRIAGEVNVVNVAVAPPFRRQGIGRALFRALLSQAVREGATLATLEVRVSQEGAIHLYESEGFRPVAHRRGYYQGTGEDGLVMLKELSS